jgi:hypothetical protein
MLKAYFICSMSILILTACSKTNYDECLVDGLKGRANEALVQATEQSCRRRHEIEKIAPIDVVVSRELSPYSDGSRRLYAEISNESDDIVTIVKFDVGEGYEIKYDTWIEPSRWVEVELPSEVGGNPISLKEGEKLDANTIKVIPVK